MAVVWIAAVAQVQSLAQEFLHTVDMAKKKKKTEKKQVQLHHLILQRI